MPPRIRPLTPAEAPAAAQPIFARFLEERGNVPNLFRTLALRPEIMVAFAGLLQNVTYAGTVDLHTKELAMLRVSQLNGSAY